MKCQYYLINKYYSILSVPTTSNCSEIGGFFFCREGGGLKTYAIRYS